MSPTDTDITQSPDDFLYTQPGLAATAEALIEVNCAGHDKDSLLGSLAWEWLDQTLMIARAAVLWRAAGEGLIDGDPRTLAFAHLHDRCGEDPEAEQQVEALVQVLLSTEELASSTYLSEPRNPPRLEPIGRALIDHISTEKECSQDAE